MSAPAITAQTTLTVAQLTAQIKNSLEGEFPSVWVTGEISNYARPQSGHSYFTLKDDQAQIRAVMWRGTSSRFTSAAQADPPRPSSSMRSRTVAWSGTDRDSPLTVMVIREDRSVDRASGDPSRGTARAIG